MYNEPRVRVFVSCTVKSGEKTRQVRFFTKPYRLSQAKKMPAVLK